MVMISRIAAASTAAALFGVALADLQITNPTSNSWWVAGSQNVLTWTCSDSPATSFTVLIANKDPKILVAPSAFLGVQPNADCSKTITQDEANQPAGTGYTILLADILNSTHIYATSQEFEIKPLGSAYPTTSVSVPSSTGGSAAPSGTAGTSTNTNDASSYTVAFGFGFAAIGAVLGLMTA